MIKTISALALGLGFAGAAQAQDSSVFGNPVFLTGSTAFRSQIFHALHDLGLTAAPQDASGSNWFTYSGTLTDTTGGSIPLSAAGPVTVFCSWSGSVEGVQTLLYSTNGATYQNVDSASYFDKNFTRNGADIAMSDIAQSTCYQGTLGGVNYTTAKTGITLVEARLAADIARHAASGIAVQPFVMVVDGNAQSITSLSQFQFIDLFHNGQYPLSYFTGNASDAGTPVYAVGRYNLSGTRGSTVSDYGYSLLQNLHQYALSADGSTTPGLASSDTAPPPPTGNQWLSIANNGYFTGGNVGFAMHDASVNGAPAAIAYVGWADSSKMTGTATNFEGPISFGGQVPWVGGTFPNTGYYDTNAVINGSYIMWNYERMYEGQNVANGTQTAVAGLQSSAAFVQAFATDLIEAVQYEIQHTADFSSFGGRLLPTALNESQMNVYRNAGDGGDVLLGN